MAYHYQFTIGLKFTILYEYEYLRIINQFHFLTIFDILFILTFSLGFDEILQYFKWHLLHYWTNILHNLFFYFSQLIYIPIDFLKVLCSNQYNFHYFQIILILIVLIYFPILIVIIYFPILIVIIYFAILIIIFILDHFTLLTNFFLLIPIYFLNLFFLVKIYSD